MNVLITGGSGFLGSHACELYAKKGDSVIAFDNLTKHELDRTNYDTQAARGHVLDFLKSVGVKTVIGDIRNKDELFKATENCDFIVHTAAQPAMTIAMEEPELDLFTNVVGTFNVLEAARKRDIPVVVCSSIHVYGNKINEDLKEGDTRFYRTPSTIREDYSTLEGTVTPLHASKRATELYVQSYIDTYGLKVAAFRYTGMYGPRQFGSEDHGWVANFVIKTILKKPLTVFGTGKQVRDILYASDAAEAFDAFYNNQETGIYNIGGGLNNSISLGECIQLIGEVTGIKPEVNYAPKRTGDLWYFVCDIAKAQEKLHWSPKTTNKDGITKIADWVSENKVVFEGAVR